MREMLQRPLLLSFGCLAVALATPAPLATQSSHPGEGGAGTRSHANVPTAHASRAQAPIQIDGRLDEEIWRTAPPITEFTQLDPHEGQPASERTEVRIAFDDQAIYVGAMLYDSEPVTTRLSRRDAMVPDSDFFIVLFDSYHDHRTAYRFATNPSGMKRDEIVTDGGGRSGGSGGGDTSWDPIWDVATMVTDSGWVVEMRIPFSQLRYSRDAVQTWGLQIERKINRTQENAVFSFTPKRERGGVATYGHLHGITEISAGRRLELLPYLGGRAEYREIAPLAATDLANPFRTGSDYFTDAGIDLKYRISSNVTLDATVNPDFGQVEMDPAVINLTAFETRFDEKRPFFVEGADIFRFGEGGPMGSTGRGPQLLYSRRVGRAPQGVLPSEAVYAEAPTATTILGAAKLTGKLGGGWSFGLLEAVTGRESAPFLGAGGAHGEATLEPATNYLVGRIIRDARQGQTRFGAIATATNRDLEDPALRERLRGSAYGAGLDLTHEWANRAWRFNSSFSPSLVTGSDAAIARTQRSSARYFDRPDAKHLTFDPAATTMAGYYAMGDLNKQAGDYQMKIAVAAASPGYEVNDLGFQNAADRIILDTNFQYQSTRPGRTFRRWDIRGGPDAIWNYGGDRVFAEFNVFGSWQLLNYWGGGMRLAYNPETDNDRLTRGGPLARDPRGYSGSFNVNSDNRKSYSLRGNFNWGFDDGGSWRRNAGFNLTMKPRGNWEMRVGPELGRSFTAAQYVRAVADSDMTETFGARYVFAGLDQTTVGLETRVNVTFSPALSFELYAQPLLSSGDYASPMQLGRTRSFEFEEFGADLGTVTRDPQGRFLVDPGNGRTFVVPDLDFNHRSLLGNAVLRWEWRPGSTLFMVWQQNRAGSLRIGELTDLGGRVGAFDLARDARDLLAIRPDNVFLVKLNYWLNP